MERKVGISSSEEETRCSGVARTKHSTNVASPFSASSAIDNETTTSKKITNRIGPVSSHARRWQRLYHNQHHEESGQSKTAASDQNHENVRKRGPSTTVDNLEGLERREDKRRKSGHDGQATRKDSDLFPSNTPLIGRNQVDFGCASSASNSYLQSMVSRYANNTAMGRHGDAGDNGLLGLSQFLNPFFQPHESASGAAAQRHHTVHQQQIARLQQALAMAAALPEASSLQANHIHDEQSTLARNASTTAAESASKDQHISLGSASSNKEVDKYNAFTSLIDSICAPLHAPTRTATQSQRTPNEEVANSNPPITKESGISPNVQLSRAWQQLLNAVQYTLHQRAELATIAPSIPSVSSNFCQASTLQTIDRSAETCRASQRIVDDTLANTLSRRSPGVCMYNPCDDENLSAYQILVRKQIEYFEAAPEDISSCQGRKKPPVVGQVGLRCKHCSFVQRRRGKGSVYFPLKLINLYQAAQNMANSHLNKSCRCMDTSLKVLRVKLREARLSASGGKEYWAHAGKAVGLYETEHGLRFARRRFQST